MRFGTRIEIIAVLYRKKVGRRLYEIRAAGSTRRLYTDGILHSQFNPRRLITGSVWDLLWLGLFFRPDPNPKRVLVLGLGAGTVVRQLQTLFPFVQITAVEIDPVHIELAELHFGVDTSRAKIFQESAEEFIARYRGPKFDLIIDDLLIVPSRTKHPAMVPTFVMSKVSRISAEPTTFSSISGESIPSIAALISSIAL